MDSDIRQLIWDRAKKYYPVKASHGLNHIEDNLSMAGKMLAFAKEPFTDQIYAAIVFHDSGLEKYGREIHEVHSAEIAKRELKDLFNSKDLFLIAAAIREHRASFKGAFTSMLSDICSSADRNAPNFEASVARSFLYTSEHHPEFSFEEKCETVAKHLNAKYGTKGYARFPIYYSRYYGKNLREYQRKMDALTGDVVAKIVGSNGKNAAKLYDASLEDLSDKVASNIVNDKVYHASPKKFDVISGKKSNTPNAKSSVFVSPFKHFASMFILDFQGIVDQIEEQIGKKHIRIDNFGFMEWNETPRSTTSIPSKVHVLVRTPENFKSFKGKATGYMYTIDFSKYKDQANMWSKAKDSDVEFTIHGDVKPEKCDQISYEYEVLKDTKQYNHAEESMSTIAQENFGVKDDRFVKDVILPAIKDDTLYHGSSQKLSVIKPFQLKELRDKNVKTISLTPYARLASLFCVPFRSIRENDKGQVVFHHCRMKLDEWFEDMPEDEMYKPVQTVHISHNIKQLATIDKTYTGYLHYVHAEDALVDAGANPLIGKGPYEVVSYVKELKPYKVETIKIRMIAKYSPSFAKEYGFDAEPCEPEDVATEDFKLETAEFGTSDLDIAVELLQEFNAGIEEFHHWARDLELYYLKQRFQDPQVEMVYSQIAQENILVNTVKEIFKKIAQFIAWFFKKLKDLWNYFFGRMQRKIRLYRSLRDITKKYLASNAYFNEKAFRDYPAPTGMVVVDEMLAMMDEAWAPDKLHAIFKEIFDLWEKDPIKLHDIITIDLVAQKQAHRFWPLIHTGYGNGVGKGIQDVMLKLFPAKGTIYEAGLTSFEDVDEYCKSIDTALTAYLDITKLFSAHGDIMTQAQRRILDYADRTDITEKEASEMANKVKALSGILKNLTDVYTKSFDFILGQGIMVMETAHKFLKK